MAVAVGAGVAAFGRDGVKAVAVFPDQSALEQFFNPALARVTGH